MPLFESDQFANVMEPEKQTPIEELNQVENESPAFWSQTIPAAFQRESGIVSGLSRDVVNPADTSFDYVPDFNGYEDRANQFAYVYSKEQELALKSNLDRQKENEQIIRESGWLGVLASFVAGAIDPINFIPVGGQAVRIYKTGNFLKGAASTARVGLLSSTVSEAALHASQETRTFGESAANVTAGTLLSGVLGGAIGAFRDARLKPFNKSADEIEKNINEFLTVPDKDKYDLVVGGPMTREEAKQIGFDFIEDVKAPDIIGEGGSVGAAQKLVETNEIKTILGSERLKILALGDRASPVNRTLTSPNIKTRETVIDLAEVSYIMEKNVSGIKTKQAVETVIKSNVDVAQYDLFKITSGAFEKYSDSRFIKARAQDKLGLSGDRLKYDQFKIEIDKAMRNNDTSAIPEVQEAARTLRKMVDDIYNVAVKEGLAERPIDGPKGAPSWMRRIYDKQAIHSNRTQWSETLRKWFREQNINDEQFIAREKELNQKLIQDQEQISNDISQEFKALKEKEIKALEEKFDERIFIKSEEASRSLIKKLDNISSKEEQILSKPSNTIKKSIDQNTKSLNALYEKKILEVEKLQKEKQKAIKSLEKSIDKSRDQKIRKAQREKGSESKQEIDFIRSRVLDDLGVEDAVLKTTNNILGNPEDVVMFRNASSGPFKERVFDIPDELIQDYLIQDVDVVLGGYFKSAIREIELKRAGFDNEGLKLRLEDMTQQSINDQRRIEAAIKKKSIEKQKLAKTPKEIEKILNQEKKEIGDYSKAASKQLQRDIKTITGIRDRIRGTFQLDSQSVLNVDKFTDTVKSLNYGRLLGQVVLSSLNDIATPIVINGMTRILRDSLVPFIRDLGSIAKQFGKQNKTGVRAQSIQELKDMGIALELILNTRVKNFSELGSSVTGSKLTAFNANTTNALSFLSGITTWNDKLRLMSGYSSMARILRATQSKKISKSDTEFLARFGIDSKDLKRIGDQFRLHGSKERGRFASGSANWTDKEAYQTFQNAIRKFVDQTIIVPGQEKPFFASTTWGSVFLQFKSFALSSYSKVFLAGLQQADLAALNGAITMVSLGMMSFYIKSILAGRVLPDDIGSWIKEGVDKSGILGHMFDVNETLVKAGVGITGESTSRFQSRNFASAVAGPTAGLLTDIATTGNWVRRFANGERPSESDIHATRRIIPFQNVVILRKLFDKAEEGVASAVGATKTKKKSKRNR